MGMDRKSPDEPELVGNSPTQRNWRGILIALLVIIIVCSLIVTAVILVTPKHEEEVLGEMFTFEDMLSGEYKPRHFAAKWIGDKDIFVYRSREGELMEFDVPNNLTERIMDNTTFRQKNTDLYYVSEDLKYVLIAEDKHSVYRHSFTAKYSLYSRHATDPNHKFIQFPREDPLDPGQWRDRPLQYAGWSTKGNALAFVYDNELWYQASPDETPSKISQPQHSGNKLVFNGIPDWVYEEEILHSNSALWWSPSGTYICYITFDDTEVPLYRFPYYGQGNNIYGDIDEIAYPKAGDHGENAVPKFYVYLFDTNSPGVLNKKFDPPVEFENREIYVTQVAWQDDSHVLITWTNRPQNKSIITLCEATTTKCRVNLVESVSGGWVRMSEPLFIDEGESYLMILPEQEFTRGYWRHIALISTPTGREGARNYLTHGTWEVTEILAYDKDTRYIYFIGTNSDPKKRHLFKAVNNHQKTQWYCLTCDYPEECQYVGASFSASGKYYIEMCEGPGVPTYTLRNTENDRAIVLEDNADLKKKLEKKALPKKEYHEVEIKIKGKEGRPDTTETLWAQVYLPPILKKAHITQYPLLIHTYGGPGNQQVTERFVLDWGTYLSSAENVIYAAIDGRGSGGRGDQFLHSVYRNLGTVEVEDQIAGAKYMKHYMQYVDEERVAIWGWSYGGFVTAHALGHEKNSLIKCGVAVAPVTDWRYYDTVYTERFMGLAHGDNYAGYDNANVSSKAPNFKDKHFMLVHGTADDNVHFQHSAQLMKKLTENNVDFRIQLYADKNHGISGPITSRHLHRTMTQFLQKECWDGGKPRMAAGEEKKGDVNKS